MLCLSNSFLAIRPKFSLCRLSRRFSSGITKSDKNEIIYQTKEKITDLLKKIDTNLLPIDLVKLQNSIQDLDFECSRDNFWDEPKTAQIKISELNFKKENLKLFSRWKSSKEDLLYCLQLIDENPEESFLYTKDFNELIQELNIELCNYEVQRLLSGKFDKYSCKLAIQSGLGGQDAQDWASMLLRMYQRYADKKGFRVCITEIAPSDCGIKGVELEIDGTFAYGFLRGEKGTHRLVRSSPFNSLAKRQTSFARVDVWPILDESETSSINISNKDLEITTFRSSGPGGQNVNKVETCVRIKHLPTGITVKSQIHRTQTQNKLEAMKILKEKLLAIEQELAYQNLAEIKGDQVEATFGQQIRNYVFSPYKLVKDLRTGQETSLVQEVLDGNIDDFISSYLRASSEGKLLVDSSKNEFND